MVQHPVWIVLAPFCAMCQMNDGRYLAGVKIHKTESTERNGGTMVSCIRWSVQPVPRLSGHITNQLPGRCKLVVQ